MCYIYHVMICVIYIYVYVCVFKNICNKYFGYVMHPDWTTTIIVYPVHLNLGDRLCVIR